MTIKIVEKKLLYWWDFGGWSARSRFIVYRKFFGFFWVQIYWCWERKLAYEYADSYKEMKRFNKNKECKEPELV